MNSGSSEATVGVPGLWSVVRQAYTAVACNPWRLAKIAFTPLLVALAVPVCMAAIQPIIILLLSAVAGGDLAFLLQLAGIEQVLAFLLLLAPFSYFSVRWLHFLSAAKPGMGTPAPQSYLPFLYISPLLYGLYPAIVFLNQIYIGYGYVSGFRTSITDPATVLPVEPHWAYGVIIGALLEAVVVARLAPAFSAAAFGERLSLTAAWQMTRGQTLRNGLIWLLTYRLAWVVFAYVNNRVLAELLMPEDPSFSAALGGGDMMERIALALLMFPLIAALFVAIAIDLQLVAAVHRPSSPETLAAFD